MESDKTEGREKGEKVGERGERRGGVRGKEGRNKREGWNDAKREKGGRRWEGKKEKMWRAGEELS